ncbi:transcriptional regulator MarR family [Dehalogenimonas sp. WBC-2]|nr:transcriptional regulator MarR family [Dehalogenimonas sp. WBC-2]
MNKNENIDVLLELMGQMMNYHPLMSENVQPWLHLELTREQLRVIFLLACKGEASPGEVAEAFGVPKANVTSVIDRLVGKGLVSRRENTEDRRGYILSLTKEGENQVEQLRTLGIDSFKRVLERMDKAGLESLRSGLEALITVIKEGEEAGECKSIPASG